MILLLLVFGLGALNILLDLFISFMDKCELDYKIDRINKRFR